VPDAKFEPHRLAAGQAAQVAKEPRRNRRVRRRS
jgi:hypothetical protein